MKASTAGPAFTNIITLLGFFSVATISFMDLAPITFVPEKDNFLVLQLAYTVSLKHSIWCCEINKYLLSRAI